MPALCVNFDCAIAKKMVFFQALLSTSFVFALHILLPHVLQEQSMLGIFWNCEKMSKYSSLFFLR